MTLIFQVLAAALAIASAYFLWTDHFDWAFAFFAFAVCSYFLGMRFAIKKRIEERKAADTPAAERD